MNILVTGATGFVGSHLVEKLSQENEHIRCLVRNTSNTDFLKKLGVKIEYGDLTDEKSLLSADQ